MQNNKKHYCWLIMASCMVMTFFCTGMLGAQGVFIRSVTSDLHVSVTKFVLYITIAGLATVAVLPIIGNLFKKYNLRLIISAAVIMQAGAFIANGLYHSVYGFYISGIFLGTATAVTMIMAIPVLVNNWFSVKTGTIIGFIYAVSGIGTAVMQSAGSFLIANYGWRAAYIAIGIVVMAVTLPFTAFVMRTKPAEKALAAYGAQTVTDKDDKAKASAPEAYGMSAKEAYKSPLFILVAVFALCVGFALSIQPQIPNFASSLGVDVLKTGMVASVASLLLMVGKASNGWLNDKIGMKITVIIFSALGLTACVVAMYQISAGAASLMTVMFIAALLGLYFGVPTVTTPIIARNVFGTKDYSLIYSKISMLYMLASALGNTIHGILYDLNKNYLINFALIGVLIIVSVAIALTAAAKTKQKRAIQ